jgi:hypothetical protein
MILPIYDLFAIMFLVVVIIYVDYSLHARFNPRYPILLAIVLLVAIAISEANGDDSGADLLSVYAFILLCGGFVLLVIDHFETELTKRPARGTRGQQSSLSSDSGDPVEAGIAEGAPTTDLRVAIEKPGGQDRAGTPMPPDFASRER